MLGIQRKPAQQAVEDPDAQDVHYASPAPRAGRKDTVVFVGPMEHHSNLCLWRESDCILVVIKADESGRVDCDDLLNELKRHAAARLLVGSFSAAANVTGVMENVIKITKLLHEHGALSLWDYAAAGPHVRIDMNPGDDPLVAKDAVFLSPHKFAGGPGTPGLLVIKKSAVKTCLPQQPGGGTIEWVTRSTCQYSTNIVDRETGKFPYLARVLCLVFICMKYIRIMKGLQSSQMLRPPADVVVADLIL